MSKVDLHFDLRINVDNLDDIDELGNALAADILGELFNGEDVLEVSYKGHSIYLEE